jgi:renalase
MARATLRRSIAGTCRFKPDPARIFDSTAPRVRSGVDPEESGVTVAGETDVRAGVWEVIIVGAGIAGLCAAGELIAAGRRVLVLEKSRGIGGRMATRRIGAAVCDHGAQFFTVRGRAFGALVAEAEAAAAVTVWCRGFARAGAVGDPVLDAADGHARWRGKQGMTDLPKRLAALAVGRDHPGRCDIRTGALVTNVAAEEGRVRIALDAAGAPDGTAGAEMLTAAAAILTAPVPQTLALLAAADVDASARGELATVAYDPCFALMLVLARPSLVPPPGAIQFAADAPGPLAWLADNQQKGISPVPALTIHASGAFSREHFDAPSDEVAALLLEEARPWIDGDPVTSVVERSLHRWKFAQPRTVLDRPLVAVSQEPAIVCCGDAFAGPKVEGAASSGLAAGRWVARRLAASGVAP